jgi:hypothetical protein
MKRLFILDKSGSMHTIVTDTIGGYNSFVESQKSIGGTISLYVFSDNVYTVYKDIDIDNVKPLTRDEYNPCGSTALLDAIGITLDTSQLDDKTMVIILTDGEENASVKYNLSQIKSMIDKHSEAGVTFMYLGANQDAFSEAMKLGIRNENAATFDVNDPKSAFRAASDGISHRYTGDMTTPVSVTLENHRRTFDSPYEY